MVFDPVTTAVIYIVGLLLLFTLLAALAEYWDKREDSSANMERETSESH